MLKNKTKIGIIGIGCVGGAVKNWFEKEKYPLFCYDKYKGSNSLAEVNRADIVFICVPTPFHKESGYDDKAIYESLENLLWPKIIVIKSTILPGSTEKFQKTFPRHKILFNPEFLRAKTAREDFLYPDRQIVGYTPESKRVARKILDILPPAPCQKIIPSKEAEMIKYFGNAFLASKVIFANQIYDLCQALSIDYNIVKEVASYDSRIGHSHLDIFRDSYRGYAGNCFPKDIKALLQLAQKKGVDLKLIKTVDQINENLTSDNPVVTKKKPEAVTAME